MGCQSMVLTYWNFKNGLTSTTNERMAHQCWYTAGRRHDNLLNQTTVNNYYLICSAGVGRSGTFIAIDIEMQRIKHENLADVYNCVCRLRFWRDLMVQSEVCNKCIDRYRLNTIYTFLCNGLLVITFLSCRHNMN